MANWNPCNGEAPPDFMAALYGEDSEEQNEEYLNEEYLEEDFSDAEDVELLKLHPTLPSRRQSAGEAGLRHRNLDSSEYRQINQSTDNSVCIEMDLLVVGSEPVGMRCPYCTEDIMTRATYTNTSLTHIIAIFLGVLFWWLCCCIVPYFVKRWKNVEHYCPNCRKFLGVYARKTCV